MSVVARITDRLRATTPFEAGRPGARCAAAAAQRTAKLLVALLAVAAAVALVLLLIGLRRGLGEQATIYLDHQPAVLVGQAGTRDLLSQTSVLDERLAGQLQRMPGVGDAAPISEGYAMLSLHGKRVLALLIGYVRRTREICLRRFDSSHPIVAACVLLEPLGGHSTAAKRSHIPDRQAAQRRTSLTRGSARIRACPPTRSTRTRSGTRSG